jgi:phage baseplate assembly protein W
MEIAFPFRYDGRGRTAETSEDRHIRDLIEQVLFTSPGERVNRPTFGCGLLRLVFAPNGDAAASAAQMTVQGALQQWLGNVVRVDLVEVENIDSTLRVTVTYLVLRTQERLVADFVRRL